MAKRLPSAPPVLAGLTYVRPLGSGGFADVFLYEQAMPRRSVAVKVLPSDVADPELRRMFNYEADVLAHLSSHPSIVTVYQAGISADGRPYIVMEYCPGSLAQRFRVERMPVAEVLEIGVKMASALESAHRAGLVHRDVKPSNILTTSFGVPVLADFGISASLAPRPGDQVLAMSVPWSAPEVLAEETTGTVASEIWGLGATVYSLLAGRSPFEEADPDRNSRDLLRRRILRARFPPLHRDDVPDGVQVILRRAMAPAPAERYPSALAMAEALRGAQLGLGLAPTTLDVARDEWATASVDFSDTGVRGQARSAVVYDSRRRPEARVPLSSLARDEDTEISGERRPARRVWPWLVGVVVGLAVVAAVVLLVVRPG